MTPTSVHEPHHLPDLRLVRGRDGIARLFFDGQEFPYPVLDNPGFVVEIRGDMVPLVTLTVLAGSITVDDSWLQQDQPPEQLAEQPVEPVVGDVAESAAAG